MANAEEILECLNILAGAFADRKIDAKITHAYKVGLEDLEGDLLIQATGEIVRMQKWYPRIAEIRQQVRTIKERMRRQPARIKQDPWCMTRDRLFVEFWALHPGDYPTFDADFQRFALERMPAEMVRLEPKC